MIGPKIGQFARIFKVTIVVEFVEIATPLCSEAGSITNFGSMQYCFYLFR